MPLPSAVDRNSASPSGRKISGHRISVNESWMPRMKFVLFSNRTLDAAVILLLICGGASIFLLTDRMPVAARTFPRMMAAALIGFCVLALLNNLVRGFAIDPDDAEGSDAATVKPFWTVLPQLAAFVLSAVGFILLMPVAGFEGAGAFLMLAGMFILDARQALRFWWLALILPPVLGFIFRNGLYLRLPLPPFFS